MNQSSSKRYKPQVSQKVKGDFKVINILTKEVIDDELTFEDATLIAGAWNHQYCKPNLSDKYFVQHKNNQL